MTKLVDVTPKEFLELVGQGCASGNWNDWSQLRPACKWAVAEVERLEAELASLRAKTEWREVTETQPPIADAPKFTGYWLSDGSNMWLGERTSEGWKIVVSDYEVWQNETRCDSVLSEYHIPTHWLPLPELPEVK